MFKTMIAAAALLLAFIATDVRAQTASGATDKKAVSKACSEQATAKGLHGKERKTFRSECKKNGGKPS